MLRAFDESPACAATVERPAATRDPIDVERRIEDWLVCYLDDQDPRGRQEVSFLDLMECGADAKRRDQNQRRSGTAPKRRPRTRHWTRISVRIRRSVAVVKLLDQMLIKENVVQEVAEDLGDLLRAGHRRIVLNFENVERMSSQIVGVVGDAHRRCADEPGGLLKICGLKPQVAEVFALAGLGTMLAIHPDESKALHCDWPQAPEARALPLSILTALTRTPGGATEAIIARGFRSETPPPAVRLVVASGRHQGSVIPVRGERFLIGRAPECRLRARSLLLSRTHAAIERQGERVVLRDLGSRNGTNVNGRILRGGSAALVNGDRVTIGPLHFIVEIGMKDSGPTALEDLVVSWIADDGESNQAPDAGAQTQECEAIGAVGESEEQLEENRIKFEVIQNVLVVKPTARRLDDDEALDQLRSGLAELSQRALPRRVVLDFDCVTHISSRCVGILLAHFLRLDRDGGAIRLCQLHARVLSVLEHFRLPVLLEAYSSVDEAVITSWD